MAIIDKNANAFRRLPDDWAGRRRSSGSGSTATTCCEAGIERGRRRRRGHQRRQHQHPHRPHRPGDLRDPPRGGPDLRPAAGRDLPAARDPHRGHGELDGRPGGSAGSCPRRPSRRGPTRPARSTSSSTCCPSRSADAATAELADGERFRPVMVTRGGQARLAGAGTWSARRATSSTSPFVPTPWPTWIAGWTTRNGWRTRRRDRGRAAGGAGPGRRVKVVDRRGGVVGRSIARDLASNGHEVLIIESDPAVVGREQADEPIASCRWYDGRRLRGQHPPRRRVRRRRRGGGGHRRRRGQSGRVAAGQTGVRRAPSDRPGQSSRRTCGCSTRPGASTCRCRPRIS